MSAQTGIAVVYCEGAFNTPNGKTAHGLIRFTERYTVIAVIDSAYEGSDSGMILDGKKNNIPLVGNLEKAISFAALKGIAIITNEKCQSFGSTLR